jgi:hypothetical protein
MYSGSDSETRMLDEDDSCKIGDTSQWGMGMGQRQKVKERRTASSMASVGPAPG